MARKSKLAKGNFTLKNNLITLRYRNQSYTTSLFDKKIQGNILVCQFSSANFNINILKDFLSVQLYLDIAGKIYIARVKTFHANVTPAIVVLQLTLAHLKLKEVWDLEFLTPSAIYDQILSDKKFFTASGRKLEDFVKPLGLLRKTSETDQALRRRTFDYLNWKMADQDTTDTVESLLEDIKKKREDDVR